MFLTDISDKFELFKTLGIGLLIYVFIMTVLFFLLLFHVIDIHTLVEQLQKCVI